MKYYSLLLIYTLAVNQLQAQEDFSWWAAIHNWDGHTPWNQYIKMSTSFMGPNAIPVPEVSKGLVDSIAEVEVSGSYHYSKGDKTTDFFMRGYLPLYENRMAVSVDVIPYEWFQTDTIIRDMRAARTRNGKGGAGGDIYLYTNFQIFRSKQHLPDILLRFAFRTASGTNLRNARYTDGSGYFFDISAGKNYKLNKNILRLFIMGGFYSYQTQDLQHLQNDCTLYGCGADIHFKNFLFSQSIAGYSGYLNIGDKPMVYRASLRIKNKLIDWKISYQYGINDYDFQRVRVGLVFHYPIKFSEP